MANRILSVGSTGRAQLLSSLLDESVFSHISSRGFMTITGGLQISESSLYWTGCLYCRLPRVCMYKPACPVPTLCRSVPGDARVHHQHAHGHTQHGLCCARVAGCGGWSDGNSQTGHVWRSAAPSQVRRPTHSQPWKHSRQVSMAQYSVIRRQHLLLCWQHGAQQQGLHSACTHLVQPVTALMYHMCPSQA